MSDPAWATQLANIEEATGRDLAWWIATIEASGYTAHGKRVAWLKSNYGVGHGNANLLARLTADAAEPRRTGQDLIEAQYAGKRAHLRPVFSAVLEVVQPFGDDVEVAPKKTAVSLRRRKQFAVVTPATNSRVDLGINLKGEPSTERLEQSGGMCSHRVRLSDAAQVDAEVAGWLREAYSRA